MRDRIEALVRAAQEQIIAGVEGLDSGEFRRDSWTRDGGGGGLTCVLQEGTAFEKAGVNFSAVHGVLPPAAARSMGGGQRLPERSEPYHFYATGVSVVLHPRHPLAPTAHCNYRYFEIGDAPGAVHTWWFGGGADLTPMYLDEDDARHFHRLHREACDRHDPTYYPRFKKWCDDYFLIEHRGERRGVGGIFFDDLHGDVEAIFRFVEDCSAAFVPAYIPLVEGKQRLAFQERHKRWQHLRRGRYVEFNLVYDRGTTFGLRSAGRTESILISMPLNARWEYCADPEPDSEEARLVEVLREPRDW